MNDLKTVFDEYDLDDLSVYSSHDGYYIENSNGEYVWEWNVEYDGEPWETMDTLFEELGFEIVML